MRLYLLLPLIPASLCTTHFLDPVYYYETNEMFLKTKDKLHLLIGPAKNFGGSLTYLILIDKQNVLAWYTIHLKYDTITTYFSIKPPFYYEGKKSTSE